MLPRSRSRSAKAQVNGTGSQEVTSKSEDVSSVGVGRSQRLTGSQHAACICGFLGLITITDRGVYVHGIGVTVQPCGGRDVAGNMRDWIRRVDRLGCRIMSELGRCR